MHGWLILIVIHTLIFRGGTSLSLPHPCLLPPSLSQFTQVIFPSVRIYPTYSLPSRSLRGSVFSVSVWLALSMEWRKPLRCPRNTNRSLSCQPVYILLFLSLSPSHRSVYTSNCSHLSGYISATLLSSLSILVLSGRRCFRCRWLILIIHPLPFPWALGIFRCAAPPPPANC